MPAMLLSERRDAGHVGRFSLGVATLVARVDAQAPASPRRTTKSSPLQSFVASRCPRARFVALRAAISPCCSRAHVKGSCIGKVDEILLAVLRQRHPNGISVYNQPQASHHKSGSPPIADHPTDQAASEMCDSASRIPTGMESDLAIRSRYPLLYLRPRSMF